MVSAAPVSAAARFSLIWAVSNTGIIAFGSAEGFDGPVLSGLSSEFVGLSAGMVQENPRNRKDSKMSALIFRF